MPNSLEESYFPQFLLNKTHSISTDVFGNMYTYPGASSCFTCSGESWTMTNILKTSCNLDCSTISLITLIYILESNILLKNNNFISHHIYSAFLAFYSFLPAFLLPFILFFFPSFHSSRNIFNVNAQYKHYLRNSLSI